MSSSGFRQDMPPKEGYAGITWERIPLKKPWSGAKMFAAYTAITVASWYVYAQNIKLKRYNRRENDDVTVAIEPLLIAERDRINVGDSVYEHISGKYVSCVRGYLNQLRKNREDEAELMKNVPGWKVGTLYGEPIYKTIGDHMLDPSTYEYYAHTDQKHRHYMHTYQFWY